MGGTTLLLRQLLDQLARRGDVRVRHLETGPGRAGRLGAGLRVAGGLARQLSWAQVVSVHASPPGLAALLPALVPLCRLARRRLVARVFGGSLDVEIAQAEPALRARLERILDCDRVLVETRQLLESLARSYPAASLGQLANHRPLPDRPPRLPTGPARRFVFLGHVTRAKGVLDLVEAVEGLADPPFEVAVYGPEPQEPLVRDRLRRSQRVHYGGLLPHERVAEVLAGVDALVLPTTHAGEGHPGAVLEAFVAGRPVVATRWRALPELVEDGASGLLVPPGDAQALAAAMSELARSGERLHALARGAWRQAQHFDAPRWTERFLHFCTG